VCVWVFVFWYVVLAMQGVFLLFYSFITDAFLGHLPLLLYSCFSSLIHLLPQKEKS